MGLFGTNLFQKFKCVFFPILYDFAEYICSPLDYSSFKNSCRIHSWTGKSVWCSGIHFTLAKTMNKLISAETCVLKSMRGPSETGESQFTIGSKLEPFNQKLMKFTFFINNPSHFMMLCKKKLKILCLFKLYTLN